MLVSRKLHNVKPNRRLFDSMWSPLRKVLGSRPRTSRSRCLEIRSVFPITERRRRRPVGYKYGSGEHSPCLLCCASCKDCQREASQWSSDQDFDIFRSHQCQLPTGARLKSRSTSHQWQYLSASIQLVSRQTSFPPPCPLCTSMKQPYRLHTAAETFSKCALAK
jgi:hypothetical protein